jgi:hypothetical protein
MIALLLQARPRRIVRRIIACPRYYNAQLILCYPESRLSSRQLIVLANIGFEPFP